MRRIIKKILIGDYLFLSITWLCGTLAVILPIFMVCFLLKEGIHVLSWDFLTEEPQGFPLGTAGGIWPAIKGSLFIVCVGIVVSLPLAVSSAVFLSEYCSFLFINRTVSFINDCLAGVPSVVYGLCGYALFVVFSGFNVSLISGGLTLALIMFPQIFIGTYASLSDISPLLKEAGMAYGVTKTYVIKKIIFPLTWPRIIGIASLSAGHAMGAAAPILFTAAVIHSPGRMSLSSPVMTLPTHLYFLVGEGVSFDHAYGTALVLVVILIAANIISGVIKKIASKY